MNEMPSGVFVGNAFMRSATFREEHGPLNGKKNNIFVGNAFMHSERDCIKFGWLDGKTI